MLAHSLSPVNATFWQLASPRRNDLQAAISSAFRCVPSPPVGWVEQTSVQNHVGAISESRPLPLPDGRHTNTMVGLNGNLSKIARNQQSYFADRFFTNRNHCRNDLRIATSSASRIVGATSWSRQLAESTILSDAASPPFIQFALEIHAENMLKYIIFSRSGEIGRRTGLKIQRALGPCRFESDLRHPQAI